MALRDFTVDTNVLMHASNPGEPLCENAAKFLIRVRAAKTLLCVDEGFSLNEADNRSHIGSEYLTKLHIGTIGHALIAELARIGRLAVVSRTVPQAMARKINQTVSDKSDRVFARVAHNSQDKTLVSHDFVAFPRRTRGSAPEELSITIIDATAAAALAI